MYGKLMGKQTVALKDANNLLAQYEPSRPADNNPATTVHLLVEALNQYGRLHH